MANKAFDSASEALSATDEFYRHRGGFKYDEQKVTKWLREHITLPRRGRVLDLCCGDGIWSKGMKNLRRKLEFYGVDISAGGIARARQLLGSDEEHFVVADTEAELPFPQGFFDVIFARGPGLYCQHDMDRPSTIAVIEMWHSRLKPHGRFYSIIAARPEMMGSYTPADEVTLPLIQVSRHTEALQADGGHYHHTVQSFRAPFLKAKNVHVEDYRFFGNQHFLITRLAAEPQP